MQAAEKVIYNVKGSRRGLLLNYIVILILVYFTYFSYVRQASQPLFRTFMYLFFTFAGFILLVSELRIINKRITITDKRLILHEGILSKHHTTINYPSITEVASKQSVFARILNYGEISIHTSAGKIVQDLKIEKVGSPLKIKKAIEHFMIHRPMHN